MNEVDGIRSPLLVYNGDNPLHLPIPESFVAVFRFSFAVGAPEGVHAMSGFGLELLEPRSGNTFV